MDDLLEPKEKKKRGRPAQTQGRQAGYRTEKEEFKSSRKQKSAPKKRTS
jgi:hypothetical protein